MRVLVDEQDVPVAAPTLASALQAARTVAERSGRVVIEATLDGVAIPDEALAAPPEGEFAGSEVRFGTADPAELVSSTMRGVADALAEARNEQAVAADMVQRGELQSALTHVGNALGVWDQVRAAVINGTALLGLSVADLRTGSGEQTVEDSVRSLAARLGEVKRSFAGQDWSALGDALAYDMQDEAERWEQVLRDLADQIDRAVRRT